MTKAAVAATAAIAPNAAQPAKEPTATSAISAPLPTQQPVTAAVGVASEQDRFLSIVSKIQKDAAKADVTAALAKQQADDAAEATDDDGETAADDADSADAAADGAEATVDPKKPTPPAASDRKIALVKSLLGEGGDKAKAVEEIEKLLGKDALAALKLDSKQWAAFRHEKRQANAAVEAREAQLRDVHSKLVQHAQALQPFAEAKQLFDDGDYAGAFEKAFGTDINEFQKRALKQKQGEDPKVSKLERELKEMRKAEEQKAQQQEAARAQQAQQQAIEAHMARLGSELKALGDSQIGAAADMDAFVDAVFDVQREHYDRRTDTTLPTAAAAEIALERIRETHNKWVAIFGAPPAASDEADDQGDPEQATDRAEPARPATKPKAPQAAAKPKRRSLPQTAGTEASSPGKVLTPEQIIAKYERTMTRTALEEMARELG